MMSDNSRRANRSARSKLSRRAVLRGAGVALALPWLPSLTPPARAQTAPLKRLIPIYLPNGASVLWWETTGSGAGDAWQLSPLLAPFEPFKEKMLMLRQLGNFTWRRDLLTMDPAWTTFRERNDFCGVCRMPSGAYISPSHSRNPSALLNCIDGDFFRQSRGQDAASSSQNGETVDQLIARSVEQQTPLLSMQVGILDGPGDLDQRHSAMSRNMSWSENGTPLGKDLEPADVFDKLVGAGAGQDSADPAVIEAAERRRALDLSALDTLSESVTELQPRLGQSDNERLDQFLTGVRELEERANTIIEVEASCEAIEQPGRNLQADERARAMNDLIVMALECDVTRIITYMLDNSRSDLVYNWVPRKDFQNGGNEVGGTSTAYHESQHHSGISADFASITNWNANVVADLLQKMDAVQEEEGTLLDNSLVMFASGMHHGDHAAFDLPFLLFGSGGGTFRQNELVSFPEAIEDIRQVRDVHYTVLNSYFELGVESFGEDMRGIPNELVAEILA